MARTNEKQLLRVIGVALSASAALVLALVVVRAWNRPVLPWDSWSYHLPFAARLHGIGGGADGFILAPLTQAMFDGFPLLAEWLQGALWRLFGSLGAVTAINSLALVAFVAYSARALRLPFAAQAFGLLAVPMVPIHAVSGYIDLFVASALAIQAIAAVRCLEWAGESDADRERPPLLAHALVFVAAAGVAGNAKFTGFGLACAIAGSLFARAVCAGFVPRMRAQLMLLALVGALAAGLTTARNVVVHSRFFYPFSSEQIANYRGTGASPRGTADERERPAVVKELLRASSFFLSATEIDWSVRDVEPRYNIDSNAGDKPGRGRSARTGGWWGAYVVAHLCLLVAGVVQRIRRRRSWSRHERHLVILFALVTPVVALAPLSEVLRYWMVWPLLLVTTNTLLWAGSSPASRRHGWTVALVGCFLWSYFALPTEADLSPLPALRYEQAAMRRGIEPAILAHVEAGERFCLDAEFYPMQFRYSRAIVGGEHVVEQVAPKGRCRTAPRLDAHREPR